MYQYLFSKNYNEAQKATNQKKKKLNVTRLKVTARRKASSHSP
jgi:hypothetical protein